MKSILLLAANPKGTNSLRLQEEERAIKERLRLARYDVGTINSAVAARPRDIQQSMLDFRPQIVHFSGHGGGRVGLFFEDETGKEKLISTEALASLFKIFSSQVECVVLNACYSALQAKVISQYIKYVIGMSDSIGDRAAIEFSVGFYIAIGAGESVELAYKLGCNAIQLEGISGHLIPVLFQKGIKIFHESSKPVNSQLPDNSGINVLNRLDFQEESFFKLHQLLESRQWEAADQETARLLLQCTDAKDRDCLKVENLETIPCSVLQDIDQLWLDYSNRKFGFSVQSVIWQQKFRGELDGATERYLGNHFGWREGNDWKDYNKLIFDLDEACRGHLPCFFLSSLCWRYDTFLLSLLNKFVNCTS
jgi:GUN4-like/CHAT domain